MRLFALLCLATARPTPETPNETAGRPPRAPAVRRGASDRAVAARNATLAPLLRSPRLMLAPRQRLLMCELPGVGSRAFVALFEAMTGCAQHPVADCVPCASARPSGWQPARRCCRKHAGGKLVCLPTPQSKCGAERLHQCKGLSLQSALTTWLHKFRRLLLVSDPELRFISAYLDKYSPQAARNKLNSYSRPVAGGETWARFLARTNQTASLALLLDRLERRDDGRVATDDEHLRSQVDQCRPDLLKFTHVYRHDDKLNETLARFFDSARLPEWRAQLARMQAELDPSAHRFHARLALRHCGMLDRESRLKIRALYRDDYEWLPRVAGVDFEGCGKLSMPVPAPTPKPTPRPTWYI